MTSDPVQNIFTAIIIANAIAVFAGMVVTVLLRERIKKLSPERWAVLGTSGLFQNDSIGSTLRFQRYVFGSGYRELKDPAVNRLALASKLLLSLICLLLASAFATIFWAWGVHPLPYAAARSHVHSLNIYGAALLGILTVGFVLNLWTESYLKRVRPETWKELGSPSFTNRTIANSWKQMRFIWSAEHKQLSDPKLSMAIYATRSLSVFIIGALFLLGPPASR